ncbi:MAG: hypothetical protein PWP37_1691 [Thermotogota bacterium]|nr:hypothetical protein [Thermotogota bacterium]MDK2865499.1 hypothetical protein [Thermotogota bacterium]HCZ05793.1 hypothetical protein [Thermotogota bacterium]
MLKAVVYGIELFPVGKIHYHSSDEELHRDDLVLVMTEFGPDVGRVLFGPREMTLEQIGGEVKPIIKKLDEEDLKQHNQNLEDAKAAFEICKEKIAEHGLPIKLLHSRYIFDRSRLLFYFSAEGRVDFRALVKDLARIFKTRIELRQVGARDEVKFIGGLGICGQETCCTRHLRNFTSVTLKHAKKQQMLINPVKISGQCRKLLCCLAYEHDFYEEELEGIPDEGSMIRYEEELCKVITVNVFLKEVTLLTQSGQMLKLPFSYFRKKAESVNEV